MRAVVMSGFNSPDQVRVEEVPDPGCGANDVLIRVVAAGVNPVDWKECEGNLQPFYGTYAERWIPGYDVAGTVHSVGDRVHGFKVGDRVVAFSDRRDNGHNGTFAEYVRVLSNAVSIVPAEVDLVEAAAIPTAALTAYQALFRPGKAALRSGDSVLIHGASGGVGSYAVQFAKARGVQVAATCSTSNLRYVASLGADLVIDYAKENIVSSVREWRPDGVHAVVDCVSGNSLPNSLDALRSNGRLLSIATLVQDGDVAGDIEKAARRGFTKILSIIDFDRVSADLGEILGLMAGGHVRTPPLTRYPLESAAQALQHMKQGKVRGKIVVLGST
jgi:NADPH2:quinone reductase